MHRMFNAAMEHICWENRLPFIRTDHEAMFLMGSRAWWPENTGILTDWDFCILSRGFDPNRGLRASSFWGIDHEHIEPLSYFLNSQTCYVYRLHFPNTAGRTVDVAVEIAKPMFDSRLDQHQRLRALNKSDLTALLADTKVTGPDRYRIACRYLLNEEPV